MYKTIDSLKKIEKSDWIALGLPLMPYKKIEENLRLGTSSISKSLASLAISENDTNKLIENVYNLLDSEITLKRCPSCGNWDVGFYCYRSPS